MAKNLAILILLISQYGCASSSHILVGSPRHPNISGNIRILLSTPQSYEKIAIVSASSKSSLAITDQEKMNVALERLAEEAAGLGANAIILGYVGDGISNSTNCNGNISEKYLSGTAIFVDEKIQTISSIDY